MQAVYHEVCQLVEGDRIGLEGRVVPHLLEEFTPIHIDDYVVPPLPADHDPASDPVIYFIEDGKSTLLYANDTGIFGEAVWKYLANRGRALDFVSLDCTAGLLPGFEHGHLGLDTCISVKERMMWEGIADKHTRFCLNHFSHNCLATYDELLSPTGQAGFFVSYDGMNVEF